MATLRVEPAQPRREADIEEPLHHRLPGERRRDRRVEAAAQERDREQRRRDRGAEQRHEQRVRLAEFGDLGAAGLVEGRGGEDQDRGVDEQREHQGRGRVDRGKAQRLPLFAGVVP